MRRLFKISWMLFWISLSWLPAMSLSEQYGELHTDGEYSVQALWHFDDLNDATANNNDCTSSGASQVETGKFGRAYEFDGSTSRLDCGTSDILRLDDGFSAMAWIYPTGWGEAANGWGRIFSRYDATGKGYSFWVCEIGSHVANDDCLEAWISTSGGAGQYYATSPSNSLSLNVWQHVAVTVEEGGALILYINAKNVAETDISGGGNLDFESSIEFIVGDRYTYTRSFDGILDEIVVYDRILSAAEISAIYAMQKGAYGIH